MIWDFFIVWSMYGLPDVIPGLFVIRIHAQCTHIYLSIHLIFCVNRLDLCKSKKQRQFGKSAYDQKCIHYSHCVRTYISAQNVLKSRLHFHPVSLCLYHCLFSSLCLFLSLSLCLSACMPVCVHVCVWTVYTLYKQRHQNQLRQSKHKLMWKYKPKKERRIKNI